MKRFKVTVNGVSYEVEVEEIQQTENRTKFVKSEPQSVKSAPEVNKSAAVPAPELRKSEQNSTKDDNASPVAAPMPGTVLEVKVKYGDIIVKGQPLIVLEAMKMENEILSPKDGKVSALHASVGSAVKTGEILLTII